MAAPQQKMDPRQSNLMARNIVIQNSIDAVRQIYQNTFTTGAGTILNIPLQNVGLIKRLYVKVAATVSGTATKTMTLSTLGASNFFSSVVVTDLSNQVRVQTSSAHLIAVSTAKYGQPFGGAIVTASTDTPFGYGNAFVTTQTAPATITNTVASNNVFLFFEVPLSYSDTDLRGALYAGVVNATMNLQLTVNPSLFVASGADATFAMYQGSDATLATMPSCTITVYQNYLDQLPIDPRSGSPILPILDISTAYLLQNTVFSGLVANQDNPFPYPNFRDILSTWCIYDNNATLNAGTDIAAIAIQSANFTNIFRYDASVADLLARQRIRQSFPKGTYYIDTRIKPISTIQYGNMSLLFNFSSVAAASASLTVCYEMLALINQVTNAGSLAGT